MHLHPTASPSSSPESIPQRRLRLSLPALAALAITVSAVPRSATAQTITANFQGISFTDIGSSLTPPTRWGRWGSTMS